MLQGNVRNLLNKLIKLLELQLNGTTIQVSSCAVGPYKAKRWVLPGLLPVSFPLLLETSCVANIGMLVLLNSVHSSAVGILLMRAFL